MILDVKKDPDYFSKEERLPYTETEVQVGQDGTTLQHINTEMENIREESDRKKVTAEKGKELVGVGKVNGGEMANGEKKTGRSGNSGNAIEKRNSGKQSDLRQKSKSPSKALTTRVSPNK